MISLGPESTGVTADPANPVFFDFISLPAANAALIAQ